MAQYVPAGNDLIDIFGGGYLDQGTRDWIEERSQAIYQTLSGASRAFIERSRELYQTVKESQALQVLRNLRSKEESVWSGSMIEPLLTLERLQTANPVMQRYIMAEPTLRRKYLNQEVDGYSESYVNHHGDAVGMDHYDWRRVMHGVVEVDLEEETDFVFRHFLEDLHGDTPLTVPMQVDILRTFDYLREYIEQEDALDPTDVEGKPM